MMPSGWIQGEDGTWRRETKHHMGRRLPSWDYRRQGYYVITLVLADRRTRAFGALVVKRPPTCAGEGKTDGRGGEWLPVFKARGLRLAPDKIEAKVVYSELGRAIFDHFKRMGEFTPGLKPVFCAVMPDHLHLLIRVETELKRPLGNAVGGFKTGCEKIFRQMGGEGRLFAEGFVDEIVLRAGQLATEFNYLLDNPRRLAVKLLFPELFKISREIRVDLRLTPQGQAGRAVPQGQAERAVPQGQAERAAPQGQAEAGCVRPAPAAQAVGFFSAIGNHFLLTRRLCQVQVSRQLFRYKREARPGGASRIARDAQGEPIAELSTREYEARRDELLAAAKHGAVLLSPCVSDGERQIAHEALALGMKLITLHNKGFAKLQKPSGRFFDACAAGRLLMLAPAAWPHQVAEKPMTRLDATAMNRLCQWIAGDDAAEINYHGMRPENVDELACAAARVERRNAND